MSPYPDWLGILSWVTLSCRSCALRSSPAMNAPSSENENHEFCVGDHALVWGQRSGAALEMAQQPRPPGRRVACRRYSRSTMQKAKSSRATKSTKPLNHHLCPNDHVSIRSLLPSTPQRAIQLDQAAELVTSCARQRKFGSV